MNEVSLVGDKPNVIAPFLRGLFASLDHAGIIWAIMRGWERLPVWTRYDVDILVARKDSKRAEDVVKKVALSFGWRPYGVWRPGNLRSIWLVRADNDGQSYLRIDIEIGNGYRGIEIHESQQYLKQRVREEGASGCLFWRMPIGYMAASVLLKQLAVHGEVDTERRREQVFRGVPDPVFQEILRTALHDRISDETSLSDEISESIRKKDWVHVNSLSRKVRTRVFKCTVANVWRMFLHCFRVLWIQLHPFMRLVVVFVGPDGSGKTTIADKVEARFRGRPFQGIFRIHMHFGVPRIKSLVNAVLRFLGRGVRTEKLAAPGERHVGMGSPHSIIRAMCYVTYYGLGMLLGRLRLFFWRTQGGLVIADRFFQDYYYMRGFINCPVWYIRMVEFLTPHPDFIFSLERSARDIYKQKPELTEEEISRQQERIQKVLSKRENFRCIDASHGVEETVATVTREIERWIISHSA